MAETRFLLPLLIACLAFAEGALKYGARGNFRPFFIGVAASVLILIGRFVLDLTPVTFGGIGLLLGAYGWSFWLRRVGTAPCSSCIPLVTASEIPIACALDQVQLPERKEFVARLAREATERRNLPDGVSLYFAPVLGRVAELAKLVDFERACCPFLTFSRIEAPAGKPIRLDLIGPVEAQSIIQDLIPERAGS